MVECRAPRRFERVDEHITRTQLTLTLERIKLLTQEHNQRLRGLSQGGQGQHCIICGDDMVLSSLQQRGKVSSLGGICSRNEDVRHVIHLCSRLVLLCLPRAPPPCR